MKNSFYLGNHLIQNFEKPFIIAEIGANHNGDMELAKRTIDAAVSSGADAVKFQSWDTKSIVSKEEYDKNQTYNDSKKKHFGSLREMVERYYLRKEQHFELKEYCNERNIIFCSTPFSDEEVDLLEQCEVPFYKVASMDLNNISLLKKMASTKKPLILSTGMARIWEIDRALELLEKEGAQEVALLHCISIYPPAIEDIHLNNIPTLRQTFGIPVGFSDHSIGFSVPLASVALGACIIEKHFTLDKNLPGWDHEISANPEEFAIICSEALTVQKSLGSFKRTVSEAEESKKLKFRRSVVVRRSMKAGDIITIEDLVSKRPGTGIPPDLLEYLVGRILKNDVDEDSVLSWDDIK